VKVVISWMSVAAAGAVVLNVLCGEGEVVKEVAETAELETGGVRGVDVLVGVES
jgi:ubiquinone/menaquinone biosynthesis C-methylase UbiE